MQERLTRDIGSGVFRTKTRQMNLKRWMQNWQTKFNLLGVELQVADVGQSSLVVDIAQGIVVLSPFLKVSAAEKVLERVYGWLRYRPEPSVNRLCSFVSY